MMDYRALITKLRDADSVGRAMPLEEAALAIEALTTVWRPIEGDTFYKCNVYPGQVVYCRRDDGRLFEMTIPALPSRDDIHRETP